MKKTKVVTGVVRLSYVNVWEPKSINGGEEKYSVSIIISNKDYKTLGNVEEAVEAAIEEGKEKFGGSIPSKASLILPLKDGDERDEECYHGCYYMNANSSYQPFVVDRNVVEITDKREVYSGIYARVSVNFYPFNVDGKMGVACGLLNIQKIRDGEVLSGRSRAEDDFEEFIPCDEELFM